MTRWILLGVAIVLSEMPLSWACQGFTVVDAHRNGPYIGFRNYLTKTGGLDFRPTFGTFRASHRGLYFFTYTSDAPITLRKNRVIVATNFYEGGILGSSSAVLHLLPGDVVYLYAREGPIKPFAATFSGFIIGGDSCYGGFGGFDGDNGFSGGGDGGGGGGHGHGHGGGYNGGRFIGSQPPSPAIFGRRGNKTASASPTNNKSFDVEENLGQPDTEDKIHELIK